jgi:hypothetical protein
MDVPCPHSDFTVRVSCHGADFGSHACLAAPMASAYCCGRPGCRARAEEYVFALTRRLPVMVPLGGTP